MYCFTGHTLFPQAHEQQRLRAAATCVLRACQDGYGVTVRRNMRGRGRCCKSYLFLPQIQRRIAGPNCLVRDSLVLQHTQLCVGVLSRLLSALSRGRGAWRATGAPKSGELVLGIYVIFLPGREVPVPVPDHACWFWNQVGISSSRWAGSVARCCVWVLRARVSLCWCKQKGAHIVPRF